VLKALADLRNLAIWIYKNNEVYQEQKVPHPIHPKYETCQPNQRINLLYTADKRFCLLSNKQIENSSNLVDGSANQIMTGSSNQSLFNGQHPSQGSGVSQSSQTSNQLSSSDKHYQLTASGTAPQAQKNTTSTSQGKKTLLKKNKQKNSFSPASSTTKLRKFKQEVKPGSISKTEEGFEYHTGTTKSKNQIFKDKTKSKQKVPKQSTWDKDAKIAIGRWGEEYFHTKLLTPGCKYFAEKYPNYELVDEYIMPTKKQVLIKEKNEQGTTRFRQQEAVIQQHVRAFVDRTDASRTLDIIWNNQLKESRMSCDFKLIEY
jgi:hypothetical protein